MRFGHLLSTLLLPTSLLAQQPDLSGRWVLNEAESQYPGPRPDGARTYIPSQELVISVDGVAITLESTSTRTLIADGNPHTRVTESGDSVTDVASWEDEILTVESERVVQFGLRRLIFRSTRSYNLSANAVQLIIEARIRDPRGSTITVRLVYDKVS